MPSSAASSPGHACKSCPCFSDCERVCNYGYRCMIASMTVKNSIRRYARYKRFDKPEGCDFFEWVDDSLCDKVMPNVVGLMMRNDSLLRENEQMMKCLKDWECDKKNLTRMKEKNVVLKMEVKVCHNTESLPVVAGQRGPTVAYQATNVLNLNGILELFKKVNGMLTKELKPTT
ncbi:hypothetical protein Cgig2_002360 [Carnegiea gigantea]|uniref:Uncharacterized protein n=1 Tax=Carnegiea gigantea TaxID=171969 RepID=A0A9Q1KC57_9CARY|nr:hypothetical protein Cgig2_002360 [Carnegiea gigantea]